jgi:YD repeat-containing protein
LLDRLQTSTQRGKLISYTYDKNGNRTGVSTAEGSTTYTFDNRNRLKTAVVSGSTTTYTYFPDGKPDNVAYPNGTVMANLYDDADRITQVKTEKGGQKKGGRLELLREEKGSPISPLLASARGGHSFETLLVTLLLSQ